jgi:TetR/AcrR family transcriptional regulator, transcriptional repressor for nem operon
MDSKIFRERAVVASGDDLAHPMGTMRYQPEHKAEVHRKIVKDASRRVRAEGLNGAAVAAVMRSTGLTHGGFYKHFGSKSELLMESLQEAFRDIGDTLAGAAENASDEPWKAIVKTYLSPRYCEDAERGCPLTALAPDLARVDAPMRARVLAELVNYKNRMVPYMPGKRAADKERAFFAIFSTMAGAVEIARMLPERAAQEKVLGYAREFLLGSF